MNIDRFPVRKKVRQPAELKQRYFLVLPLKLFDGVFGVEPHRLSGRFPGSPEIWALIFQVYDAKRKPAALQGCVLTLRQMVDIIISRSSPETSSFRGTWSIPLTTYQKIPTFFKTFGSRGSRHGIERQSGLLARLFAIDLLKSGQPIGSGP